MNKCPTHNRPLVRTHGGSLICFACFFAKMRKQRSERVSFTNPALNTGNKARAADRRRAAGVPVGKGHRRKDAAKPGPKAGKK